MDDTPVPGLLETTLVASLERALNTALRADPATLMQLGEDSGHLLEIRLRFPARSLFVLIVEDGVECYLGAVTEPDVRVEGHALDLAAQLLGWRSAPSVIGGPVRIEGNRELLQRLTALAQQLDVDWGALLAPVIGPELAAQLDHGARQLFSWARDGLRRLARQGADYLRFESGLVPSRHELREFGHEVVELQMATERLEARLARLTDRPEGNAQ
ncbi:ubiquinone biosynthesis accessory factor UbiJ [Isoalcanivorax beigongshangi]|uniref:Ubiquinone biosynthesis accessory factor UbiJ n=1 Tax=Isoalcanivorax beigongshangi TaxID=3238810 RepID=A0ABV4AK84_9GAMM